MQKIKIPKYIGIFENENGTHNTVPYYSDEELIALIDATPDQPTRRMAVFELHGSNAVFGTYSGVKFVDPRIVRIAEGRN